MQKHHFSPVTYEPSGFLHPVLPVLHRRNAIEGTQSALVRVHGLRRARYRGLAKVRLQNYFAGAACNIKRGVRREIWNLRRAVSSAPAATETAAN